GTGGRGSDYRRQRHGPAPACRTDGGTMSPGPRRATWCAVVAPLLLIAARARPAGATCNVIPSASQTFRATGTTVDRPFAIPGEFVTLALDGRCGVIGSEFSPDAE